MNRRDFFKCMILGGTAFAATAIFPQQGKNQEAVEVAKLPISDQLTWTPSYSNQLEGTLPDHLRFKVTARCEGTLFGTTTLGKSINR